MAGPAQWAGARPGPDCAVFFASPRSVETALYRRVKARGRPPPANRFRCWSCLV